MDAPIRGRIASLWRGCRQVAAELRDTLATDAGFEATRERPRPRSNPIRCRLRNGAAAEPDRPRWLQCFNTYANWWIRHNTSKTKTCPFAASYFGHMTLSANSVGGRRSCHGKRLSATDTGPGNRCLTLGRRVAAVPVDYLGAAGGPHSLPPGHVI